MRRLSILAALLCVASSAFATECPKDINPCKVMILTPQQLQWLAGTPQTSAGSVLDVAAKAAGSDASAVIAQILNRARAAVDGAGAVPSVAEQ